MTALGGFDLVFEFVPSALAPLIRDKVNLGGNQSGLPFELERTIPPGQAAAGSAYLIVRSMDVDLPEPQLEDHLLLTVHFDTGSLAITSPVKRTACGLDGRIEVAFPILLSNAGFADERDVALAADFSQPRVATDFSTEAEHKLDAAFGGLLDAEALESVMDDEIRSLVQSLGVSRLGGDAPFRIDSDQDGDIAARRFCRLELHTLYDNDPALRRVVLLGSLLTGRADAADFADKDKLALHAGREAAIRISPEAFHRFLFCAQIAAQIGQAAGTHVPIGSLPSSCGDAESINVTPPDVTFKELADRLEQGHILVHGAAEGLSGICWTATATFDVHVTLDVQDGNLVAGVYFPIGQPDITITIPWYCYVAAGATLWVIVPVITEGIRQVVNWIADPLVFLLANLYLLGEQFDAPIGGSLGLDLTDVSVAPDALEFQGTLPKGASSPPLEPSVVLIGSVDTEDMQLVTSGEWKSALCPGLEQWWAEFRQSQRGTYRLDSALLGKPLTRRWWISDGTMLHELSGQQGSVSLELATSYPPVPGGGGGGVVTQTVDIQYWISEATVVLANDPDDGNYVITLVAEASDCDQSSSLTCETAVLFQGNRVLAPAPSMQALLDCLAKPRVDPELPALPDWPPIDHPAPQQIPALMRALAKSGSAEGEQMLLLLPMLYGRSYEEAVNLNRGDVPAIRLVNQLKRLDENA